MVLVLEKDKIRARVGKFYVEGKEIKWDKKDRVEDENNEDEEDIVIESETAVQVDQDDSCHSFGVWSRCGRLRCSRGESQDGLGV